MKYIMKSLAGSFVFSLNRNEKTKCTSLIFPLLALAAGLVLAANPAQAVNILGNPSFEANNGHVVPAGWTIFAPPNAQSTYYWVVNGNDSGDGIYPHSGNFIWKDWFALTGDPSNTVAGIYQTFNGAPGST